MGTLWKVIFFGSLILSSTKPFLVSHWRWNKLESHMFYTRKLSQSGLGSGRAWGMPVTVIGSVLCWNAICKDLYTREQALWICMPYSRKEIKVLCFYVRYCLLFRYYAKRMILNLLSSYLFYFFRSRRREYATEAGPQITSNLSAYLLVIYHMLMWVDYTICVFCLQN